MAHSTYVPGVCNIGETEIKARKKFGWTGLAITVLLWAALDLGQFPPTLKLILFLPASMGAAGLIQGFLGFCAGFGMKGVFNFGDKLNKTDSVSQAEYRAKDTKRARQIFLYSIAVGIMVAAVAYFI